MNTTKNNGDDGGWITDRLFDWLHRRTKTIRLKRDVHEKTLIIETVGGKIIIDPYAMDRSRGFPLITVHVEANEHRWIQKENDATRTTKEILYIVAPHGRRAE